MDDILEILKDLIPTVIIISTFLLPAFLRKKKKGGKEKAQPLHKKTTSPPPSGKKLEDKVRKYFEEMVKGKKPEAAGPPKPAPPPAMPSAAKPPEPAPIFEPAAPQVQTPPPFVKKPKDLSTIASSFKGAGQAEDAYTIDREAYTVDSDAYTVDREAYTVDREAYTISKTGRPVPDDLETISSIRAGSDYFHKGDKKITRIDEDAEWIGKDDLLAAKEKAPAKPDRLERDNLLLSAARDVRELRRAIVLKEIFDRPVGIKGFCDELLW